MMQSERYEKIVTITNERGFVSTKELSDSLKVTETTIRRDTETLDQQGLLIRVHGGAKSIRNGDILSHGDEIRMTERIDHNKEKRIVAKKAASFVKDGDCIFLDGGTSALNMIDYLKDKKIKIVTNNHLIAYAYKGGEADIHMLGGKYLPEYNMVVGPVATEELEKYNFDYAFISAVGVDMATQTVYTTEVYTAAVKKMAISRSMSKYLLLDDSKFSVKGFCGFLHTGDFDGVICNDSPRFKKDEIPDHYILVENT